MKNTLNVRPDFLAAVFLGSVSVLLFEMGQIRTFSYSLPPILAYTGISLAMTGFGIGAMLLSLMPSLLTGQLRRTLAVLGILQAVAMVLSSAIFARTSWGAVMSLDSGVITLVVNVLIPCMLPYFFGGLFIAIVFSSTAGSIGKVYFFNLIGSGFGTMLITLLLTPLGAENVIGVAAVLSVVSAIILSAPLHRIATIAGGVALVAIGCMFPFLDSILPFQPDPMDVTGISIRSAQSGKTQAFNLEFDEWNIVGRIEIWNRKGFPLIVPEKIQYRALTVDSGASTVLIGDPGTPGWGKELFEETIYGLAYHAKPKPAEVLVIGTGGGIDVQTALHFGAGQVTAVEINSTTIGALKGKYAPFLKWPLSDRVSIIHEDGRSVVKSPPKKFDVIQLSGVDTLTVYATGAFNMVEEYLYTLDAFEDYLAALKPDGVLGIIRFGKEHLRLTAIAAEALMRQGVTDPQNHIAAFKQDFTATILVSKSGFTDEQLKSIAKVAKRRTNNSVSIPAYEMFGMYLNKPINIFHLPGHASTPSLQSYFNSITASPVQRLKQTKKMSIPTDDNPFFLLSEWISGKAQTPIKNNVRLLDRFWTATAVLALVLIILPVLIFARKLTSFRPLAWVLPYFFLIGTCFMMLEVGIINMFSIFVGSPGAATAVVLTSILFASGVGSYVSELIDKRPEMKIAIGTAILLVSSLALKFLSPSIFDACWSAGLGQVTRSIIAGAIIVPMGFAMGWFFPSGLKALDLYLKDGRLMPWAISINGFASVLGSITALPITIFYGFSTLFITALTGYIIAGALSFVFFMKKSA
ncbi:MAG: hypothetical protein GY847_08805 [Proteobacteria bacterium]|nr:hypothetical protein [Pseudomonadota bacterium]